MSLNLTILAMIYFININFSNAWWDGGHMIVARIGLKDIEARIPESVKFFEDLTHVMDSVSHGKIKSFMESAVWADVTKGYENKMMDPWHYKDVTVNNTIDTMPYIDLKKEKGNALDLVFNANNGLTSWKPEEASKLNDQFEKSFFLRFLIHVIGDIHQPLHSCTWVDEKFPDGDLGGNLFKLTFKEDKTIKNLHSIWDAAFNNIYNGYTHPITDAEAKEVEYDSNEIMKEFPKASLSDLLDTHKRPVDWVKESWTLCKNNVYKGISINDEITKSSKYVLSNIPIARKQMALAGYRVSQFLENIWNAYKNPKEQNRGYHQNEPSKRKHLRKNN